MPKKKDRIIFGEWFGKTRGDSPYLMYTYARKMGKDVYFITKTSLNDCKQDENVLYAYSLKGIGVQLTAKIFICNVNCRDYYPFAVTPRNILVQNGHGPAIKAAFQSRMTKIERIKNLIRTSTVEKYTHAISPHATHDASCADQWKVSLKNIIRAPDARCDQLLLNSSERDKLRFNFDAPAGKKVVLYCPTHRNEGKDVSSILIGRQKIFEALKNKYNDNFVLITKPHSYDYHKMSECLSGQNMVVTESFTSFELMAASDLMISDYSGIVYDYSYLKKPIICFAFDYDTYREKSRSLLIQLDDLFNCVCYNENEISISLSEEILSRATLKVDVTDGNTLGELSKKAFQNIEKKLCLI